MVHDIPEKALEAEVDNVDLAEAALVSAKLKHIKKSIDTSTTTLPAKPTPEPAF